MNGGPVESLRDMAARAADVKHFQSVCFLLFRQLERAPLPADAMALVVRMPAPQWNWFSLRPRRFQEAYRDALTQFLRLKRPGAWRDEARLILESARDDYWNILPQMKTAQTATHEEVLRPQGGYFIVVARPGEIGALWVAWQHAEAPRQPDAHETLLAGNIAALLQGLIPDERSPQWNHGEECLIDGRRVIFYERKASSRK